MPLKKSQTWYEICFLPHIFPSHPKSHIKLNALIANKDDT